MKKNVFSEFDISKCCGCGACINKCAFGALTYTENEYGFLRPQIDQNKCKNCGECLKVCPFEEKDDLFQDYPQKVYAAVNRDDAVLMRSSSGGVFFELARYVLQDEGIVVASTMNDQFEVFHMMVSSIDEIKEVQKSKYVQSNMNNVYIKIRQNLENGRRVLFVGTPCQVAAVKKYCAKVRQRNDLILVDIVCHGVPSNALFRSYINMLKNRHNIEQYVFRAKKKPLNGMNCFFSYKKNKKWLLKNWPEDSFNCLYQKALIYRDSCYECPYATAERVSDITLCDFWKWEKFHRDAFAPDSSVSGIIINSEIGNGIVNLILKNFVYCKSNFESLSSHNSSLLRPVQRQKERDDILKLWAECGYDKVEKLFRKKNRKQILRTKIIRVLPEELINNLRRWKIET